MAHYRRPAPGPRQYPRVPHRPEGSSPPGEPRSPPEEGLRGGVRPERRETCPVGGATGTSDNRKTDSHPSEEDFSFTFPPVQNMLTTTMAAGHLKSSFYCNIDTAATSTDSTVFSP